MYFQKYDSEKMWVFRNNISLVEQQGRPAWHYRERVGKALEVNRISENLTQTKGWGWGQGGKEGTGSPVRGWRKGVPGFPVAVQNIVSRASGSRLWVAVREGKHTVPDIVHGFRGEISRIKKKRILESKTCEL